MEAKKFCLKYMLLIVEILKDLSNAKEKTKSKCMSKIY